LYPDESLITVAAMLDHKACDREKMNPIICRISEFKKLQLIKDALASASFGEYRATFGALFRHLFSFGHLPHRYEAPRRSVGNEPFHSQFAIKDSLDSRGMLDFCLFAGHDSPFSGRRLGKTPAEIDIAFPSQKETKRERLNHIMELRQL
jgi:hypothetical protein